MPFVNLSQQPAKEIFGGLVRGRYAHLERTTVGLVELAPGTVVPMHQHPHEQITHVLEGRMEFTLDGEMRVMEPGMSVMVPGGKPHGVKALSACRLLDVFSPVREDYR